MLGTKLVWALVLLVLLSGLTACSSPPAQRSNS